MKSHIANSCVFLTLILINIIIKQYSNSEFERELFINYISGFGNMQLAVSDFQKVKNYATQNVDLINYPGFTIQLNDGNTGKALIISFYKFSRFNHAFGTATIYIDDNNKIVGFLDYYDFDSRPFGERSYVSEIITRSIKLFSPRKAKPFKITYGLQAITPIYDVVRDKSFSYTS